MWHKLDIVGLMLILFVPPGTCWIMYGYVFLCVGLPAVCLCCPCTVSSTCIVPLLFAGSF